MARASVHVVNLSAGTQYVLPATDVAYILLKSSARTDTSGRFRFVPEVVVVSEAVAMSVAKALSADIVLPQDTTSKGVTKPLIDSASMSDAALVSMFFPRTLADSTVVTDSTSLQTAKVFGDASAVTDALARDFVKSLVSGVAMNDSFDAGDGAVFVFTKGISNIVFAGDSRVLFTDKLIGDMIEPVDTGVLTVQNYCDITYFAADYVGVSQTFS